MTQNKTLYYSDTKGNETCFYEIKEMENKIRKKYRTSISLENSIYQYVTYFDEYIEALEYIKRHEFKNPDCL